MNKYELMVVYNSDLKEDEVKKNISTLTDKVKELKGSVSKEDFWGLKDLAYEINRQTKAYYLVLNFEMDSQSVSELEALVKADESVLRHLLTRVN